MSELTTLAAPLAGKISKSGLINGVSVLTKGEALGHAMQIDDVCLSQVLECGQSRPAGFPVKCDHGGNLLNIIGSIKNFSRQGDQVKADVQLLQSHPQYQTLCEMAEQQPGTFGLSIVFQNNPEKVGDLICARCLRLVSVDFVQSPAANPNGLFSTPSASDSFPALVRRLVATGLSMGKAVQKAVCEAPALHHKWLQAGGGSLDINPQLENPGNFRDLIAAQMAHGKSKGQAVEFCAKNFPQSHALWLQSGNTTTL